MDLKNEVCSVEYAKKLKELGVKQNSPIQWVEVPFKFDIDLNLNKNVTETKIQLVFGAFASIPEKMNEWAAFTVGQLFDLIPAFVDIKINEPFNGFWFNLNKRRVENIQYIANYVCDTFYPDTSPNNLFDHNIYNEKLADCLSKVIINLYEKGLIKNEM